MPWTKLTCLEGSSCEVSVQSANVVELMTEKEVEMENSVQTARRIGRRIAAAGRTLDAAQIVAPQHAASADPVRGSRGQPAFCQGAFAHDERGHEFRQAAPLPDLCVLAEARFPDAKQRPVQLHP